MLHTADCVVIGGGVIGCTVALRLRQAGLTTVLLEQGAPGGEATGASAGMLSPQAEAPAAGPLLDFGLKSRELYPTFAEEVRALSGIDVGYRACGVLWVALDDEDEARLEDRLAWQARAGLPIERVSDAALRAIEPALGPDARLAALIPGDHQVEARALGRAVAQAAARVGVEVRRGTRARRILTRAGRVTGVETDGETVATPRAVVAAGAWSGAIDGAGLPPGAVRPVRGQIVEIDPQPQPLRRVVFTSAGYLVPRPHGGLLVGSTMEEVGFVREVTVSGARGILAAASRIAPALAGAPLRGLWAGLRPCTPDLAPILGPGPTEGLTYATGHSRKGVLQAPLTGAVIAALVTTGRCPIDLAPFAYGRLG